MKLVTFTILTVLSLVYAGLTLAETATYHKWDRALNEQRSIQWKLGFFQQRNLLIEQLIKRMAVDSQHDPALLQLLKEHRIRVKVLPPPETVKPAPSVEATPSVPTYQDDTTGAADKSTLAPQAPTPPHP